MGQVYHVKGKPQFAGSAVRTFDPSKEVGAMQPLGYWDPLDLMKEGFKNPTGAYKSEETFRWYREAELKHGRISMLAALGLIAGELCKFPGFQEVPGGFAALDTEKGGAGFGILFLVGGIFELDFWKQDASKEPGNFGDPAGWTRDYGVVYDTDLRNKELAHCRLAMCGVITSLLLESGGYDMSTQLSFASLRLGQNLFPFLGDRMVGLGVEQSVLCGR